MLQIVGAGLPRTGTRTLCEALCLLRFNAVHHPRSRLPLFPSPSMAYTVFDGIDAVVDAPASLYWAEIASAYQAKVILTVRDVDSWWESIKWHANKIRTGEDIEHIQYTDALHALMFGTPHPCEYWWKRRFDEHNQRVMAEVTAGKLLVMDITGGDKWGKLCPFLGVEEPGVEWPWTNRRIA